MCSNERHGRARYNLGCRCDQCKCAESEYQKARRQRINESVGEFAVGNLPAFTVLRGSKETRPTSTNAESYTANMAGAVESAVSAEIEVMCSHPRPGLAATALALARILDNPRAVSTQPAAAKTLAALLDKLRSAAVRGRPGRLAVVRAMSTGDDTPTT